MNLAIDIGNSLVKAAWFDGDELRELLSPIEESALVELTKEKPENTIISAVGKYPKTVIEAFSRVSNVMVADHTLMYPIKNLYASPTTLGIDRLAGAVGAHHLFPNECCLVIDLGTCITYDFIDEQGNYYGGGISPGVNMKFKALHTFTEKLPFVQAGADEPLLIGYDTERSIKSGVLWGTVYEIEGMISAYAKKKSKLKTIICGGDTKFFESKIKAPIFVAPELVLLGLNRILQHNVSYL